jgi:SPFH domain / Band 7 family
MAESTRWHTFQRLALSGGILLLCVLFFLHFSWHTFFHYVEPGEMLVIISKTGTPLPAGQILATSGQKGIQEEVLGEGRHFVMPVSNETEIHPIIDIPPGKIGVVTARVGTDLPPGQVLAAEGQKGIWRKILPPGRHRLNPYGYEVQLRPAVRIRPGYVGFVTSLVGQEPSRTFAQPGEKGVLQEVLQPGLYYINPYEYRVEEVEVGINQVSFLKESHLRFPSEDAFEIDLEATVEWELLPENVAQVMAEFGAKAAIEEKVIVPQSRSIGRIEGSKHGAKDFLLGQAREQFQDSFKTELVRIGKQKNLTVLSAFIRHINIPDTLLAPIKESFVAVEKEKTARVWEETRRSAAALERERTLIEQRRREVQAETAALVATIGAQTEQEVANIEAHTRLRVAEMQQQIATLDAERTRTLGTAHAEVVAMRGQAVASGFNQKVTAFRGDAVSFARYNFARQLADDFAVRIIHAGPGTLWTDLKGTAGISDLSGLKILKQDTPASK